MKEVGENNCVFWSYVYLVNGCPMAEFGVERGLKQGDPLSPFLFLMAVEGLCGLVKKAELVDVFKGFRINDSISYSLLSHMQMIPFWLGKLARRTFGNQRHRKEF